MNIQKLLCSEIKDELTDLKGLALGSNEYKAAVDGIAKLADKAIELEKIDVDCEEKDKDREFANDLKLKEFEEKIESRKVDTDFKFKQLEEEIKSRESEIDLKLKQLEEERKSRLITNCIGIAGIVIPSLITIWGTVKSFEFEKEGTITTIMGRGFINKLLPRK